LSADIDRLGTYSSIDFNVFVWKPRAEFCDLGNATLDKLLPTAAWVGNENVSSNNGARGGGRRELTGIYGHDEEQIREIANVVRYRGGGRVGGDRHTRFHVSLMDGVDKRDGIRCNAVSGWALGGLLLLAWWKTDT